jgi:hypothetical protein
MRNAPGTNACTGCSSRMLARRRNTEISRGFVASAQEGRFFLACDDGRMRLMILSASAGTEPQDLPDLVRRSCPVVVRHQPAKGRRAAVAERVTEL